MHRRDFVRSGLAASALAALPGEAARGDRVRGDRSDAPRHHLELRSYELRNDIAPARLRSFFRDALLPALTRAGTGAVGLFAPDTGASQSVLLLIEYPTLADVERVGAQLDADAAFTEARRAFETGADLPYVRYESRLMRAFGGFPAVEVPRGEAARPARMFELRTYEGRSADALAHKIAMFEGGEIALFRSIGMTPVFFGENLFGTRLPSLTYMLTFDDIAARTAAWATFRTHPEWKRINADPRWNVAGNVTVTNVTYLSPLSFSPIR